MSRLSLKRILRICATTFCFQEPKNKDPRYATPKTTLLLSLLSQQKANEKTLGWRRRGLSHTPAPTNHRAFAFSPPTPPPPPPLPPPPPPPPATDSPTLPSRPRLGPKHAIEKGIRDAEAVVAVFVVVRHVRRLQPAHPMRSGTRRI